MAGKPKNKLAFLASDFTIDLNEGILAPPA
jgi:hypothetical protein